MTEEKKAASAGEKKEDTTDKAVEVPKEFQDLIEKIEKMSVLELSELVKILEKKFGVSAAAPVAAAAGAAGDSEEGGAEEKSAFDVELTAGGDQKIAVIKLVREITGKGLKESKDIVDAAPKVVKENAPKEEAEKLKKKFEEAGATVELK